MKKYVEAKGAISDPKLEMRCAKCNASKYFWEPILIDKTIEPAYGLFRCYCKNKIEIRKRLKGR